MEQVKTPRKALFVLVWGALLWGGSTALAVTLFHRHTTHQIDTPSKMVVRSLADRTTVKYSRDWTGVVQQLWVTPDTSKAVAIARTAGLEVKGDYPGLSENGASKASAGPYFVTFVDPITKAEVLQMSIIVDRFPLTEASSSAPSGDPRPNPLKVITRNEK